MATTITFEDRAGNALSGPITAAAGTWVILDFDTHPWFVTIAGNGFAISQSGTAAIGGNV